ncbi:hypothetical protein KFK09_024034 [Dendrobium nobile]|uniref:Uncharacterized protein n=1 Tax=Dendrobium nobile TaxID=94219 RepID=A0A8T3ABW8_DENNO|nr:hypothetical protein KFK09_024034 [Dendrobium nobile]
MLVITINLNMVSTFAITTSALNKNLHDIDFMLLNNLPLQSIMKAGGWKNHFGEG